jgi:FkbM family methyltransferase
MKVTDSLRRIVERASRSVKLRRRLPSRFGGTTLHVSPGAALCYYRPLDGHSWHELFEFAQNCVPRAGTVWDIGASMGVFAFAAAHIAGPEGKVLAVEADTWAVEFLKKSSRQTPLTSAPVQVCCAAIAAEVSLQIFEVPERGRSGSHLAQSAGAGPALLGSTREAHPVITVTLDWLAEHFGPPGVVKIDIEGMEFAALQGAAHVLRTNRPAVLVEVYERNADEVTALLRAHDYVLFDAAQSWSHPKRIDRAAYNTLALPHPPIK